MFYISGSLEYTGQGYWRPVQVGLKEAAYNSRAGLRSPTGSQTWKYNNNSNNNNNND